MQTRVPAAHPTHGHKNPIIKHYLIREIGKPFAAIIAILVALFAGYSAAGFLADAVNGLLPLGALSALIGLKVLIALEVLIPISLYLAVILAFSRLHGDCEFTAMSALGITPRQITGAVLTLSLCVALAVGLLSFFGRPAAYRMLHALSRHAQADVDAMAAGTFYITPNGNRVIFIAQRDGPAAAADVFVQIKNSSFTEIIHAESAYKLSPANRSEIFLNNPKIYEISHDKNQPDQILTGQGMVVNPYTASVPPAAYSAAETPSIRLAASQSASDIAEFQWRLSTPLSTILLALLAIPLSRAAPARGRYARFGTAILIYAGYYLLITAARTWVQHGIIPGVPGIWWAPALLATVLLFLVYEPRLKRARPA